MFWWISIAWLLIFFVKIIIYVYVYIMYYSQSIKSRAALRSSQRDAFTYNDEIVNRHTFARYTFYTVHMVTVFANDAAAGPLASSCMSICAFALHHNRYIRVHCVCVCVSPHMHVYTKNRCMECKIQCGRTVIKFNRCDFVHTLDKFVRFFSATSLFRLNEKFENWWNTVSN